MSIYPNQGSSVVEIVNDLVDRVDAVESRPSARDVRTKRHSTGSIAGGATAEVTVTWPTAWANTNYTVTVSLEDAANDLSLMRIVSRTAAAVVVRMTNNDAINAATGTLHVVGVGD